MTKDYTWLNYAYGFRPEYEKVRPTRALDVAFREVGGFFSSHFGCKREDLRFAQNVTTHVASLVHALSGLGDNTPVLVDSHQVKYMRMALESGRLPGEYMTRPNYAKVKQMEFTPRIVSSFDPLEFVKNPGKYVAKSGKQVIVLSHISRLTGEEFPIKQVYAKIKRVNPDAILVVDGAQAVGAQKFKAKGACDMYIGTNSKFIDAEPNLAPAYVVSNVRALLGASDFNPREMASEIHATHAALQYPALKRFDFSKIRATRAYALRKLRGVEGVEVFKVKNQAAHMLMLKVDSPAEVRRIVSELEKRRVHVFHNLDWSEHNFDDALLRVSLSVKTTKKEVDHLVRELKEVVRKE